MAVDAEGIRQAQRHLPAGLGGDLGRLPEGRLGLRAIEQIALQIDDARRADQLGIDLAAAELRADAEEGVHGALAVRRHQHQAAAGGLAPLCRRGRRERHAGGADVVPAARHGAVRVAAVPLVGIAVVALLARARRPVLAARDGAVRVAAVAVHQVPVVAFLAAGLEGVVAARGVQDGAVRPEEHLAAVLGPQPVCDAEPVAADRGLREPGVPREGWCRETPGHPGVPVVEEDVVGHAAPRFGNDVRGGRDVDDARAVAADHRRECALVRERASGSEGHELGRGRARRDRRTVGHAEVADVGTHTRERVVAGVSGREGSNHALRRPAVEGDPAAVGADELRGAVGGGELAVAVGLDTPGTEAHEHGARRAGGDVGAIRDAAVADEDVGIRAVRIPRNEIRKRRTEHDVAAIVRHRRLLRAVEAAEALLAIVSEAHAGDGVRHRVHHVDVVLFVGVAGDQRVAGAEGDIAAVRREGGKVPDAGGKGIDARERRRRLGDLRPKREGALDPWRRGCVIGPVVEVEAVAGECRVVAVPQRRDGGRSRRRRQEEEGSEGQLGVETHRRHVILPVIDRTAHTPSPHPYTASFRSVLVWRGAALPEALWRSGRCDRPLCCFALCLLAPSPWGPRTPRCRWSASFAIAASSFSFAPFPLDGLDSHSSSFIARQQPTAHHARARSPTGITAIRRLASPRGGPCARAGRITRLH